MKRLMVVVALAVAGFIAAFAAFGDAARRDCMLDATADPSYSVRFDEPVREGQSPHVFQVTQDGRPVTGAWVCARLETAGEPSRTVGAEGRELAGGRYTVPLELTNGPWEGRVLVDEDAGGMVAVPVSLDLTAGGG